MTTFGPWSDCLSPEQPQVKRRRQRSPHPLGPWSAANVDDEKSTSRGVKVHDLGPWVPLPPPEPPLEPPELGPWARPPRKCKPAKRNGVDLANCSIVDIPSHVRGHAAPMTRYTEAAKDPKKIKERVAGHGRCLCQSHKKRKGPPCHRKIPIAAIIRLCVTLASMSVEEKGYIFYHMYQEEGEKSGSRRQEWHIEGHRLCFTNFCHILFMSPQTVRDLCATEAGPDGKRISQRYTGIKPGRKEGLRDAGKQVDFFFQEYYQSAGEPLPKVSRRQGGQPLPSGAAGEADIMQEINGVLKPWLNTGDPLNGGDDEEYDPDRPAVDVARMCTLACDGQVVGLPVRFVQHSSLWGIYWQFLAHWDALMSAGRLGVAESWSGGAAPSFDTFRRRWQAIWQHYLRFRKKSEHAQCNTCFELQRTMYNKSSSVAEKLDAARHLREHIRVTYLDRQIYWNLRFASRGHGDVLVIIIDSMDKTKFAWPRYPWGRRPHDLGDLIRPRISFTIALAHGFCVDMFAAPEELNHGSDAFLEVLCRTITNVRRICRERSIPFPRHLVIQSDNTVAQAKNQYVVMFLALLVSRRLFMTTNLFFLVVGHTHEDIGTTVKISCMRSGEGGKQKLKGTLWTLLP